MEEEQEKDGGLGAYPKKTFFRAMPSRILENASFEHVIQVAIIVDLYAQKEN